MHVGSQVSKQLEPPTKADAEFGLILGEVWCVGVIIGNRLSFFGTRSIDRVVLQFRRHVIVADCCTNEKRGSNIFKKSIENQRNIPRRKQVHV